MHSNASRTIIFGSAIVLTRASVETSAALWHLCGKIEKAVQINTVDGIGDYLTKLRLGQGKGIAESDIPKAVHVNDFIRSVNKDCDGFLHQYDVLSEYTHPNWSGTTMLYSKPDHENRVAEFGRNLRGGDSAKGIGVTNLSVALMFFERSYKRVAGLIPAFTKLCESQLKAP